MLQNKNITRIVLATALLLLVPLLAMQFTDEINWNLADFVIIGSLLIGAGLMYELAAKKVGNIKYRVTIGVALGVAVLLIWAELAVGLFGAPFAGN